MENMQKKREKLKRKNKIMLKQERKAERREQDYVLGEKEYSEKHEEIDNRKHVERREVLKRKTKSY